MIGTHEFPFSILLEGNRPTTTDNHLLSIQYVFTAEARPRDGSGLTPLKLHRTIDVRRSLPLPGLPHHSVRVFPPTPITASVHYDPVVHPQSTSSFKLRLDGIGKQTSGARSAEYWKMKRLSWKLEETVTTIAPACSKHAAKASAVTIPGSGEAGNEETKKGVTRTDSRVVAHADMHSGWKADYYSAEGNIEAEIEYRTGASPASSSSSSTSSRSGASCDVRGSDGTEISHKLVVEMVVAQEYVPLAHTRQVTPTGIARILRMNFAVVLTDRGGLGVSWDNEAPPIYQDVPPSPPSYACATVEDITLASPSPLASPLTSPLQSRRPSLAAVAEDDTGDSPI